MDSALEKILHKYDNNLARYNSVKEKFSNLISELIKKESVDIHSIDSRIKSRDRLEEKIKRKDYKYSQLEDITDIIGLRVITYFKDEVDQVARIIENEFNVDQENSIDKRKKEHDKFGYLSLHYVVQFSDERGNLTEYQDTKGINAEIQIRSILQHAWAEIEHDIGYKSEIEIPEPAKRNFSRVAALLETADLEFERLRETVANYEDEVDNKIQTEPKDVTLDKASLTSLIENNSTLFEVDKAICKRTGFKFINKLNFVERLLERIKFVEINTIGEVVQLLEEKKDKIPLFAELWIKERDHSSEGNFSKGISIFYLSLWMLCERGDEKFIKKYLEHFLTSHDIEEAFGNFTNVCKTVKNA